MTNCVFARTLYTGKSVRHNVFLVFSGNTVTGLASAKKGRVLGAYEVITPAFIDAHSHIGLHRSGEPTNEGEANEQLDSVVALADALDSLQMDDAALAEAVEMGVTYSCILPGSGNIIGGGAAVIRNFAKNSTDALVARAGLKAAFGYNPMSTRDWKGKRPTTRMGALALLRGKLGEVRQKIASRRSATASKKREIVLSPEEEVLQQLLTGKTRLRVHVHKIDDIAALLRLVDEFKLRVTVEHALDVHQPEIFAELKKRQIPIAYGPVDAFPYKVELKHDSWRNIRHLIDSGADYGLMTDHPVTPARTLFLQTRWFLRAGLSKQQAVELVSRRNAELLGVDKCLGTLAKGKWASFTGWNGDPFDLASYPVAVFGEGALHYQE